jgi:Acetylaranotin biosynthesis cluster protein L/SnoaL-like domain
VYRLSRTVPVNEAGKIYLSRHDVWTGLMMKAQNALPYVPQMQKCEVLEQRDGWLLRDIVFNNTPLRERVTFEPEARVIFDRIGGPELGRIENIIGEDDHGNLTLTFAFGLTKEGIEGNTDAERAHFAPMEGAYMGAVAATLGAVRRTVAEQGRGKVPPASPDDVSGHNGWIYDFFKVADSLQMEPFLEMFADDVQVTFSNYPASSGKDALRGAIGGLWSRISAMSHSLSGAWSLHDDRVGIAESTVMYTRLDGSLYIARPATVLRRRGGKISHLRISVDVSGL